MRNPVVHRVQEKPVMRMINKYNIAELSLVEYLLFFSLRLVVPFKELRLDLALPSTDTLTTMTKGTSIPLIISSLAWE